MGQLRDAVQDLVRLYGQQAGDDGYRLEGTALVLPQHRLEAVVGIDVEEQLGHDEVGAGLRLLDQVREVELGVLGLGVALVRVALWIGGDTDAEVVGILLADVAHEVDGPGEVLVGVVLGQLALVPVLLASWGVAAQGQDVADAQGAGVVEGLVDEGAAHVGARQVQAGGQAQLALAYLSQLERLGGGRAAGAPGHIHEQRTQGLRHALQTALQVGESLWAGVNARSIWTVGRSLSAGHIPWPSWAGRTPARSSSGHRAAPRSYP